MALQRMGLVLLSAILPLALTAPAVKVAGVAPKFVKLEEELKASTICSPNCLPSTYKGPIFVSDIDDTLRSVSFAGIVLQDPIAGVEGMLRSIASKYVPILYLTAGFATLPLNIAFLNTLPAGTLMSPNTPTLLPSTAEQAAFKGSVLSKLKAKYNQATLFCLGDNKYGDPVAYQPYCDFIYIRNVNSNPQYPNPFSGYVFTDYDTTTVNKILGDINGVLAANTIPAVITYPQLPDQNQVFLVPQNGGSSGSTGRNTAAHLGASLTLPLLLSLAIALLAM